MNAPRYLGSVHLVRGIAALLVVLEHVVGRPPYAFFNYCFGFLDNLGQVGVSAFFLISGVVLPLSLGTGYRWVQAPNFFLRRIVRIEPTFLCSVLGASVLIFLMTALAPEGKLWTPSFKQLALHAFYLIPFSDQAWIQDVYWTLAVEFQFYLVIGLIFPLFTITGQRSPMTPLFLCAFFSLAAYASGILPSVQLLKYAPCFALGMVVAVRMLFQPGILPVLLVSAFIAGVGWATDLAPGVMIGCGLAALVAVCKTDPVNQDSPWIKPWWWLGTISYSLYVSHQVLASAGENIARFILRLDYGLVGQVFANLMPFGTIAVCFVAAWLLYHWVERPTLEFSKRLRK